MAIADPDRLRFDKLIALAASADGLTDAEVEDLEALRVAHPSWVPGEAPRSSMLPIERREEPFTAVELGEIARSQGCSVADLKHRWVIQHDNSYYVIGWRGEYRPTITKTMLMTSLPRDLARVPRGSPGGDEPPGYVTWKKTRGDYLLPKSVDELLCDYASAARKVVASMSIERSYYEPVTETFWEKVHPTRQVEPRYDEQVDKWLTLLGGEENERLKDWVACATLLDRPTCAVYIHGHKDAGKNMFAAGMSRLWGEGPTELESAHADFNSAIADNPLIFADEELPKGMTSGFLRKFIARGEHPLRRKNKPESKLFGYFRLVIAANNGEIFHFDGEDFSPEDVDAIAARIMYLKCHPDTAGYLNSLGGREGTADWVDGDRIAGHALWLRDNRVVARGSRFLVEGRITTVHRRIAAHGSIRDLVVEWVCKAILREWGQMEKARLGVQFGGGHVYVNTSFVKDTWETVLGDNRPPSLKRIGRALKPLAMGDPLRDGKIDRRLRMGDNKRADFYNIDPRHIYDAAASLQIASAEDFQRRIDDKRAFIDEVDELPRLNGGQHHPLPVPAPAPAALQGSPLGFFAPSRP